MKLVALLELCSSFSVIFVLIVFISGKTSCRADLIVKERLFAPEFAEEQSEAPIYVTEGGEVTLHVTVAGKPKPNVKWYKDDKPLRESNRLDIKARGDKHSVIILGVKGDDSGVYKCEGKSKMGAVTREFRVIVTGVYQVVVEIFLMSGC